MLTEISTKWKPFREQQTEKEMMLVPVLMMRKSYCLSKIITLRMRRVVKTRVR